MVRGPCRARPPLFNEVMSHYQVRPRRRRAFGWMAKCLQKQRKDRMPRNTNTAVRWQSDGGAVLELRLRVWQGRYCLPLAPVPAVANAIP